MKEITHYNKDRDKKLFDYLENHLTETKKRPYLIQVQVFNKYLQDNNLQFNFHGFSKYYWYLDKLCDEATISVRSFNTKVSSTLFLNKIIFWSLKC